MPPDPARVEDTRAWLRKARLDLDAGTFESSNLALLGDVVFHAQQAVEKSLKAFLAWHDVPFRKTHDLGALGKACTELLPALASIADRAAQLTPYAWMYRYPGEAEMPGMDEAEAALELARELFEAIRNALPPEART